MATIQNIIATCFTGTVLNLSHIARSCPNIEYNKPRFTAAIMRIRKPKSTSLIFESGRLVILGTKDEDDAKKAARRHCRILQKFEPTVTFSCFKIDNIVCTLSIGHRLDLLGISNSLKDSFWEPEIFPSLKIYPKLYNFNHNVVCNIFSSGKVVITGCPDYVVICFIVDYLYDNLEPFCVK
jgi:transcription initiation factor TFIID TATA-box-binding protein